MAKTINRRLAELIDSNGQLVSGKIANGYISTDHFANNSITDAKLHTSFSLPASALTARDTGDLSEGSNLYYTDARADARIAAADTGDLSEGSNLYYTDARVGTYISGNRSYGNITTTGYIAGPATFTIDPAAVGDNTGTVVIAGNLQVDGTTTTINSTTLEVDDLNITLAAGSANSGAANGAGITVDIANNTNPTLLYNGTHDTWDFNKNIRVSGSVGVTNIVTDKVVKFNGTILDDSSITDTGSLITLGTSTDVSGPLQFTSNVSFSSSEPGRIYKASNHGLAFHGVTGTENDFAMFNPAGQLMVVNPTGTNNVSLIPTATGNVGIGTDSPTFGKLEVNGSKYVLTDSGQARGGVHVSPDSSATSGQYGGAISFSGGGSGSAAIASINDGGSDHDSVGLAFITHPAGTGSADAQEKMRITEVGNVGIGTTSPAALLHLKSTVNAEGPSLIFENTNNAQTMNIDYYNNGGAVQSRIQYAEGPAAWYFQPNVSTGDSTLTINYNGSVDIGGDPSGSVKTHGVVVSDAHKNDTLGTTLGDTQRVFGIHNKSQNQDFLTFRTRRITDGQSGWNHAVWDITRDIDSTSDLYRYMTFGIGDVVINDFGANMDFRVESNTNANMLFVDGGTNRVGIATNAPANTLDVNGGATIRDALYVGTDNNDPGELYIADASTTAYTLGIIGTGTRTFEFRGSSSGADYNTTFTNPSTGEHNLIIDGSFTVNHGTSYAGLHVKGSNAPNVTFGQNSTNTPSWKIGISGNNGAYFGISTGTVNQDRITITDGGSVGIGDYTPSHKLDVNGVIGIKGNPAIDSDGTSHYFKTPAGGVMYFYHGTSGIMYVSSAGLLPVTDNAKDLGSTSKRWRNLYTTDLHLSNEGKPEGNEVDGTTGNWTIQEGDENLYILNNKSGKKYKFALEEIS